MSPRPDSPTQVSSKVIQNAASLFLPIVVALIVGIWLYTRFFALGPQQEHAHRMSERGGILISVAEDRYQVEALVEQQGRLRLFILGREEGEVVDVDFQTPIAYVNTGAFAVIPVPLEPDPQAGDPPGRTSQFVGQLPAEARDIPLRLTLSGLHIGLKRYQLGFAWGDQTPMAAMPRKIEDDAERQLYLQAGGQYSQSDIAANGGLTASEKFVGFQARHDLNPQSGDLLCPITRTKANPQCQWTIGGREYAFCCPPCIDEFVRRAKEEPDQIEPPEAYVQ